MAILLCSVRPRDTADAMQLFVAWLLRNLVESPRSADCAHHERQEERTSRDMGYVSLLEIASITD